MRFARTRFPCEGILTCNYQEGKKFYIAIRHTQWYETMRPESELNESDIEFMRAKTGKGLAPFQI